MQLVVSVVDQLRDTGMTDEQIELAVQGFIDMYGAVADHNMGHPDDPHPDSNPDRETLAVAMRTELDEYRDGGAAKPATVPDGPAAGGPGELAELFT